ncbi:hypothetical protein, partial [Klebsiella michiganensis]|uniref:hypothetical protein n=1 Tax=Klebsiella michiganensis TaxID=1134687 RepID=UPI001C4615D3
GLSIELRSIIRRTAAHPFGASAASALFNACGVSPSPGTTIQRTQPMAGFLLFCGRTLHRTPFDYSPHSGSPLRGQRGKRAVQRLRGELSASNN